MAESATHCSVTWPEQFNLLPSEEAEIANPHYKDSIQTDQLPGMELLASCLPDVCMMFRLNLEE